MVRLAEEIGGTEKADCAEWLSIFKRVLVWAVSSELAGCGDTVGRAIARGRNWRSGRNMDVSIELASHFRELAVRGW